MIKNGNKYKEWKDEGNEEGKKIKKEEEKMEAGDREKNVRKRKYWRYERGKDKEKNGREKIECSGMDVVAKKGEDGRGR